MRTSKKPRQKQAVKTLGVIGNPVSHSLSPLMHNAALAKLKLPYVYEAFKLETSELSSFVKKLGQKGIAGFNVTIPHKENIVCYLDGLTPEARLMGAVNTVYHARGKLWGDNTDGRGYLISLKLGARLNPRGKNIVILGAGGAAKGIALALAGQKPKCLFILNRTVEKAVHLRWQILEAYPRANVMVFPLKAAADVAWENTHIIINTTSVGLKNGGRLPIPWKRCAKGALASDIVYTPLLTPFLKQAAKYGLKIHPGWGMLLYQGALAFERFTGKKAPVAVMRQALLDEL